LKANAAPPIVDSPDLDPPSNDLKYEIEDVKVPSETIKKTEVLQEIPRKLKEVSTSPDSSKERQAHPNSIPLVSWVDEVDETKALDKGL
jgi:hypothetical protein